MAEDAAAPVTSKTDILRVKTKVAELLALRVRIAKGTLLLSQLMADQRQIEGVDLPMLFDEVGMSSMTVDDLKIGIKTEYYPNVKEENQPKFFKWLRKNGFDAMIKNEVKLTFGKGEDAKAEQVIEKLLKMKLTPQQKLAVHPATLKAFVREQVTAGRQFPVSSGLNPNPIRTTEITPITKGKK